jgi:4-hydroxy-2-oxoheptanedioate aldolase
MTSAPLVIPRNKAKDKLSRNEVVSCLAISLSTGGEIVTVIKSAGFDSIYVDLEPFEFLG